MDTITLRGILLTPRVFILLAAEMWLAATQSPVRRTEQRPPTRCPSQPATSAASNNTLGVKKETQNKSKGVSIPRKIRLRNTIPVYTCKKRLAAAQGH